MTTDLATAIADDPRTQVEIGAAAGLARGALSKIIKGRQGLTADVATRLEKVLGLAAGALPPHGPGEPANQPAAGPQITNTLPFVALTPGSNPRSFPGLAADAARMDALIASIKARQGPWSDTPSGILKPLLVIDTGETLDAVTPPVTIHKIVDGERRYRALKSMVETGNLAPGTPIPVHVLTETDHAANFVNSILANDGEPLHPADEARAFARLIDEYNSPAETIATWIGRTPRHVQARARLGRELDEWSWDQWRANDLKTAHAEALADVSDLDLRHELTDHIAGGRLVTEADVRAEIKRLTAPLEQPNLIESPLPPAPPAPAEAEPAAIARAAEPPEAPGVGNPAPTPAAAPVPEPSPGAGARDTPAPETETTPEPIAEDPRPTFLKPQEGADDERLEDHIERIIRTHMDGIARAMIAADQVFETEAYRETVKALMGRIRYRAYAGKPGQPDDLIAMIAYCLRAL